MAGTPVRHRFPAPCKLHPIERLDFLQRLPVDCLIDFNDHVGELLIPCHVHVCDVYPLFGNCAAYALDAPRNIISNNHDGVRMGAEIDREAFDFLYLDPAAPQRCARDLHCPTPVAREMNPGRVRMELVNASDNPELPLQTLRTCDSE